MRAGGEGSGGFFKLDGFTGVGGGGRFEVNLDSEIGYANDVACFDVGFVDFAVVEVGFVCAIKVFNDPLAILGVINYGVLA